MFTQIEKQKLGQGNPITGKVRVRGKGPNDKSCSIAFGADVLALIGATFGDRLDVLVGSDADLGKIAFRPSKNGDGYKLTTNGDSKRSACLNLAHKRIGLDGVVGSTDVPWWVEGGMIVASLVALQTKLRAAA